MIERSAVTGSLPLFIDEGMSRELERAEATSSCAFCRAAAAIYPDAPILAIPCAGGFGLHYGPNDLLNAVKGVGLNGPVAPAGWDALEAAFRDAGSRVVLDLSPFADEHFVSLLSARSYVIGSFETVLCRRVKGGPKPPDITLAPGMTIAQVGRGQAQDWSRVLDVGFANGGEPMRFAVDIGRVRTSLPDSIMLLATVNGEPAGGAGMSVVGDIAVMSGAAVLPKFRGRGIQQALTSTRLRLATERGCTFAKLDVRAGSASYRNAVRGGFQVAYTRPQLVREWSRI